MTTLAFFNHKGGIGKTVLVSHLAWMFAERGVPVLAVDLDPQSSLTSMWVKNEKIIELLDRRQTVFAAVRPLMDRSGDVLEAHIEPIVQGLHLLVGDLSLSRFEDLLAEEWIECLKNSVESLKVLSSFYTMMDNAARRVGAALVLVDLGPNLGPLHRAALLAADRLVLPLAPDLFSLQAMEDLGPTLRSWRRGWDKRVEGLRNNSLKVPKGTMDPIGYALMSFGVRDNHPVQAHDDWAAKIPGVYRRAVLDQASAPISPLDNDPFRLAALKHYRSLMPLAMAAHKPMFLLKPADGARGAHLDAVRACYSDFYQLARQIGDRLGVFVP